MLVLRRKEGQWIEITHRSGDVVRFRVYDIGAVGGDAPGRVNLAFDDPDRNFTINRAERELREPSLVPSQRETR